MYTLHLLLFAPFMLISRVFFIQDSCCSEKGKLKRLHIVIFLSLPLILPLSLWNFLQQLSYTILPSQAVFLLACINSTIKPFTYFLVGRYWRKCSMGSVGISLDGL